MAKFDATKLHINFMKYRKLWLVISFCAIIVSLGLLVTKGLNLSVDFTGGLVLQVQFDQPTPVSDVRECLLEKDVNATIQSFNGNEVLIRCQEQDEESRKIVLGALKTKFGGLKVLKIDKVGPVVGKELREQQLHRI